MKEEESVLEKLPERNKGIYTNLDEKENKEFLKDKLKYFGKSLDYILMVGDFLNTQPIYYDSSKIWWFWDNAEYKWRMVDEYDLLNQLRYTFDIMSITKSDVRTQIIEALKLVSRDRKPKVAPINWLQFGKWIFDLDTGDQHIASPEYFLTNPIPFKPSENPNTPIMDKVFSEWVGKDYVKTLYQIIAYCCYRDYPVHRYFIFIGSGRNGKGSFLNLLTKFIGIENCCSTELDTLIGNRFETAKLYKKTCCQMGETNFNVINKTSIIKKLTGGDVIGFELKNKNPFDDYNYAKLIIATNSLPVTQDKTDGFYSRPMIIDFPNRFSEKEDVLIKIPEEEFNNLARKILMILPELLREREFHNEGTIEERKEKYEDKSNPLQKFLKEHTINSPEEHIFKFEFKDMFKSFLKTNGYREWNETEIGKGMKELYEEKRMPKELKDNVKHYWAWIGLKWKYMDENFKGFKGFKGIPTLFPYIEKNRNRVETLERVAKTPESVLVTEESLEDHES